MCVYFLDGDPANFKQVIDTNIFGLVLCCNLAIKQMRENDIEGHIVNINSMAGHKVIKFDPPNYNVYSPTKYAVSALTEVLGQEFAHLKAKIKISVRLSVCVVVFLLLQEEIPLRKCMCVLYKPGFFIYLQSVSPGLVGDTNIFEVAGFSKEKRDMIPLIPNIRSEDVADAVVYVLGTPPNVQV